MTIGLTQASFHPPLRRAFGTLANVDATAHHASQ